MKNGQSFHVFFLSLDTRTGASACPKRIEHTHKGWMDLLHTAQCSFSGYIQPRVERDPQERGSQAV